MKSKLLGLCTAIIVMSSAATLVGAAKNDEVLIPAKITFPVTKFRPVTIAVGATVYTDAKMALAPHPFVTLTGEAELATLHPQRAVDFQIKIESAEASESYTPLAIVFQQQDTGSGAKADSNGRLNFASAHLSGSTLIVHYGHARHGPEYRYEFFVFVRRSSDGEVGIIDPGIETES